MNANRNDLHQVNYRLRVQVCRIVKASVVVFAICGMVGCSDNTGSLSGSVSYAGQTVDSGSIRLDPVNIEGAKRVASRIEDGRYAISIDDGMLAGSYRVTIFGLRSTGKMIMPRENLHGGKQEPIMQTVQYIPDRYNRRTTLTITLEPGENVKDFELK